MMLKKFSYSLALISFILFLTACIYGDLAQKSINRLREDYYQYCDDNNFVKCPEYTQCAYNEMMKLKKSTGGMRGSWLGTRMASPETDNENYKNLMPDVYKRLNSDPSNIDRFRRFSYNIYVHNVCAYIIGDKVFDIEQYMPLINEKLGGK